MTTPFLAVGILFYSLGRYSHGRPALAGAAAVYVPVTIGLFTSRERPGPGAGHAVERRAADAPVRGRADHAQAAGDAGRAAAADQAAGVRPRPPPSSAPSTWSADGSPRSCRRWWPTTSARWWCRPASCAPRWPPRRRRPRTTRWPPSRSPAATRWSRCAGCSACSGATTPHPQLEPQPSLDQAQSLVERTRADGLPVHLHVDGEPSPLARGVDLAAYRVLQETLDSAKQAEGTPEGPGRC